MTTRRAMLWSMLWIVLAWAITTVLPAGAAEGQPLDPIDGIGAGPEAVGALEAVEGISGMEGGERATQRRGERYDPLNPISVLSRASEALPAGAGTGSPAGAVGAPEAVGGAGERGGLSTTLSIVLLLSVLSLAPSILVMCTSFTRIIVVLALLRQALGTQTLPPSQVIVGLSLFLTMLVMAPTFERINTEALQPLQDPNSGMTEMEAWERAKQPLRDFMFAQIEHAGNWDAVYMILNYRQIDTSEPGQLRRADVDMLTLIPAFVLSELKVAFLLGFQLYLPFLVIDMVVSSVLISMGMLMLPPVLISLPFKLLLFVMVDGWNLVAGNLLNSFAVPGVTT
ncbi:MAG: flagellar type III secretion system pore protein FliP [Planctomycetota bacterium]